MSEVAMKEHLAIQKFGPIQKAEIDVRDLTIFVGPQATGKSLAAQVLYFLRRIEDLIPPSQLLAPDDADLPLDSARIVEATLSTLKWWFGNESAVYAGPGTLLSWAPTEPTTGVERELQWDDSSVHLSKALEGRLQVIENGQDRRAHVYIPAGRALYSFLRSHTLLSRVPASEEWPGYVLKFYETLGRTIEWLWRKQEQQENKYEFDNTPEAIFLRPRINAIMKGQIRYGPGAVLLEVKRKQLRPETIAAGQMEIWPFWAIVEEGIQTKRLDSAHIYFEEPEAHLHPGAQRNVMEIVAYLVKRNTRFLITTHSPYILYAVNNFLMAHKVLDAGKSLPDDVPLEIALQPEQVAAYRFATDGTIHDIMDTEVGLIDENELDHVADELGATFTRLQEQLEAAE
jgi:hypothetical protein